MRNTLKKRKWVQQEEPGAAVEMTPPAPSASVYPRRQPRACASILQESCPICDHQEGWQPSPLQILSAVSLIASFEVWQLLLVSLKPLPCSHLVTAPCPHPPLAAIFLFKFLLGGCCYTLLILEINFSRMPRVQITHDPNRSSQMSSQLLTFGL